MIPKKIYIPTCLLDFPKGKAVVKNVQVCNEQRDFCSEYVVKGRQMNGWKLIRYQLKIDLWAYEEDIIPMNFTEFPLPQEI